MKFQRKNEKGKRMENKQKGSFIEKIKSSKKNRLLTIFVCVFMSLLLVFGGVFGTITLITELNATVRLGAITMDEGVTKVFSSYYKYLHLTALRRSGYPDATDTTIFWQSVREEDGKTQGEVYLTSLQNYISGILAGCDLVRSSSGLSDSDKKVIKEKVEAFVSYYGSVDEFNRVSSEFGFDYDDFERAMELSYTSALAFNKMYGYEGVNLRSGTADAIAGCKDYFSSYSRVKLLFLCDEKITEKGDDGEYTERDLTDGEKEEREKWAAELREAIRCKTEGLDGAITDVMFDMYLEKSDGDPNMHKSGYYFNENATQTAKFALEYSEVVERALEMEIGEYAEVDTEIGKCFIFKCPLVDRAYENSDDPFFSDFYSDAAAYLYTESIKILSKEAVFKPKYDEIDILSVPMNNNLFVTSWN